MKYNRGFTLVEMLIVIAVIAILLGIMIPRFKGMQEEANITKSKAELKTLQTGVESWFMHQTPQSYPPATTKLCGSYLNTANPLIVASMLYDPFASPGTEYSYAVSPNGEYYLIWSVGPTGSSTITGVANDGSVTGSTTTDIYVTNGNQ
jgi:prepilin-type N-terminal cleavage/methylation domain-containing protein